MRQSSRQERSYIRIAKKPWLWELRLWREIRTFFFMAYPYQVISFIRRWVYDSLALIPPLAAGVWWVTISKGTDLPADSVATVSSGEAFLLSHHVARFYPTLIAFLLCVVLLRADRTAKLRATALRGVSVAARLNPGVLIFLGALALIDLILISGSIIERALPVIAAGAWIWLIRTQLYRRTRLLEPSGSGFRPPLRNVASRRRRKVLQQYMLAPFRPKLSIDEVRASLAEGFAYFAAISDSETCAWCLARAVDYNLGLGALGAAEDLLADADVNHRELAAEPALHAAIGLFYLAVGSSAAAGAFRHAQLLCAAAKRRVPYRMRTLLAEADVSPESRLGAPRWGGRARFSLVWNRRYATVVQDVLAQTYGFDQRDPDLAIALAMHVMELADELGKEESRSDLEPLEAINLALIKGAACERIGELLARDEQFAASAAAYRKAASTYSDLWHRARAGLASAYAAAMSLRGGLAAQDAGLEMRLLSAALIGLRSLEFERGQLGFDAHRYQLLAAREHLHSHLFRALAENVRVQHRPAAELALWLAESVHRSALAERIRDGHQLSRLPGYHSGTGALETGGTTDPRRRPVDPVDIAKVRQVCAGRVVLYYRCEKSDDGWLVWVIMASSQDVTLHQAAITNPPGAVIPLTHPSGLLQRLDSGRPADVQLVHNLVNLRSPAWSGLSAALLPPGLGDALRQATTADAPATLLIVPDGPLSAVPFAGLRLPDDIMITDLAVVMFMPNLLWIAGNAVWPANGATEAVTIVTHLGPTKFAATFRALLDADDDPGTRLITLPTADRGSLEARLSDAKRPDVVVISQHGETAADPADRFIHLSGGGKLSERDAERLAWPRTVVLGSCWASDITVRAGQDAVGLPTACLLGGASAVVGGQSEVRDDEVSAEILGRVVLEAARGRHPALALREAVLAHLTEHPPGRRAPPSRWANLTVWTSQPPASGSSTEPSWQPWTSTQLPMKDGLSALVDFKKVFKPSDTSTSAKAPAEHYLTMSAGLGLRRALRHASAHSRHDAVTTLDLFWAILATDTADWTSYSVAAEIPAPLASFVETREFGDNLPTRDLLLDLDNRVRVTKTLANSLARGERLACYLNDQVIAPAHVVYGFLVGRNGDAARWICGQDNSAEDMITLLGDRVFGLDLPDYRGLKPVPGDLNKFTSQRIKSRGRHRPAPGREFLETLEVAYHGGRRKFTTTLDFLGAMVNADSHAWRCLANAGFTLEPPDVPAQRERGHGGATEVLGMGYSAAVSEKLAAALRTGAALAYDLGEIEFSPAHVLYAMLCDHGSDASRWLRRPDGQDFGPVAVLAAEVFRRTLLPPALVAEPPEPRDSKDIAIWPIALLFGAWMLLRRGGAKVAKLAIGLGFLGLISVTMNLADLNTAQPTFTETAADESQLTGALTLKTNDGQAILPATMLGKLDTFYIQPSITGLYNQIRQTLRPDAPPDLSGLYIFAIPPLPRQRLVSSEPFGYRGGRYHARVICGGGIATIMCFAVVKLPSGVGPDGPNWQSEFISGGQPGTITRNEAVVFTAGRAATTQHANMRIIGPVATRGLPTQQRDITVRGVAKQAIRPLSPVVLNGKARVLPLLGLAVRPISGQWYAVYPTALINVYAQGIAERLAGPEPGSTAFAGILVGSSSGDLAAPGPAIVSLVQAGSPADYAGLHDGDQVTEIENRRIISPADVIRLLEKFRPGDKAAFTVLRNGHSMTLTVTLGYRPI